MNFDIDTAHLICDNLGLDGEKVDACFGLCSQLEKAEINDADFTVGLSTLSGKKPEEVVNVLKGIKVSSVAGGTKPTDIEQELRGLRVVIANIQAQQAEGWELDEGAKKQLELALKRQGELIAEQLGGGVMYVGPQMDNDSFVFHIFNDDAVTDTSFTGKTFEEAKVSLIEKRSAFGAKPYIEEEITDEPKKEG
jgi:hypothetical protein